jgi:hypothetical protein
MLNLVGSKQANIVSNALHSAHEKVDEFEL